MKVSNFGYRLRISLSKTPTDRTPSTSVFGVQYKNGGSLRITYVFVHTNNRSFRPNLPPYYNKYVITHIFINLFDYPNIYIRGISHTFSSTFFTLMVQ